MSTTIAAINRGAVHRFLTKPWNELDLKVSIKLAFERLALERENRMLIAMARRQERLLASSGRALPEASTSGAVPAVPPSRSRNVYVIEDEVADPFPRQ
jgi:hypothetical protein